MTQKDPVDLRFSIKKYHAKYLRERKRGNCELRDLANMGETYLSFVMEHKQNI